jgi:hypothetical protein
LLFPDPEIEVEDDREKPIKSRKTLGPTAIQATFWAVIDYGGAAALRTFNALIPSPLPTY